MLRTYDVAGEFRGNTLRVNLTEEKFFSLNFLNTKTSIQMGSGGDVFGSTNSGGGGETAVAAAVAAVRAPSRAA